MNSQLSEYNTNIPPNLDIEAMIPFVSYINKDSIICKNGNIIQTIVLDNLNSIEVEDYKDIHKMRQEIRLALLELLQNTKFAVYIQTIRSRKDVNPQGEYPFGFADALNTQWVKKNNWDRQLSNSLYITIVYQSNHNNFSNIKNLMLMLSPHFLYNSTKKAIFQDQEILHNKVDEIITQLQKFGPRRLTNKKTASGYYIAEHLQLFHYLLSLQHRTMYSSLRDISNYLSHVKIRNHFNHMEIGNNFTGKRYVAVFSIKGLTNISLENLDNLLYMPSEYVITQAFHFVSAKDAINSTAAEYRIAKYCEDQTLLDKSGYNELHEANEGYVNDYCSAFTSVIIHSDDKAFFQQKINHFIKHTTELGLVTIREDFYMPTTFFAHLPANFKFIPKNRMQYLSTSHIGHFCGLIHQNSGNYIGSKWGAPVTIIRTMKGTPIYVNYHNSQDIGNTLVCGPFASGKTTLIRFLLAQSLKFMPIIINIDLTGKSEAFFNEIGGTTFKISLENKSDIMLYPFDINNFKGSHSSYAKWLHRAIYDKTINLPQFIDYFSNICQHLNNASSEINRTEIIRATVEMAEDAQIKAGFESFLGSAQIQNLFAQEKGHEDLSLFDDKEIINIDLSQISKNRLAFESYYGILLVKIASLLKYRPTIIILNDLQEVFNCQSFLPLFESFIDEVNDHNAILLANLDRNEKLEAHEQFQAILAKFQTRFFMSNNFADKYFRKAFSLTEYELNNIKSYSSNRRIFLYKQDDISVFLQLNLDGLEQELRILTSGAPDA